MNALQHTFGSPKTPEDLIREDIERCTLEMAARRIEALAGNEIYTRAWKRAAELVRSLKP